MRALRWALSQRDNRSHILDNTGLGARCGHDIDIGTEPARHIVLCTQCAALLVREPLCGLEVSETEA